MSQEQLKRIAALFPLEGSMEDLHLSVEALLESLEKEASPPPSVGTSLPKGNSMTKFPLVGMGHHKPAPTILSLLPADTPLALVRDAGNQYDPNAIQVHIVGFASQFPESVDDIVDACTEEGIDCPDLTGSVMLGFIKATNVNEEVLGAETLAPRIDKMLEDGEISDYSEVPVKLVYGTTGRPAVTIETSEDEDEDIDTTDTDEGEEPDEE